jgi:hypothetical protein
VEASLAAVLHYRPQIVWQSFSVAVHGPNVHRLGSMAELAAFGRGAASRLTGARSSGRRGRS